MEDMYTHEKGRGGEGGGRGRRRRRKVFVNYKALGTI
jgi:hypothetical protein